MKAVERKLNKAQLATIWLLIISVLLAGAYAISIAIVNKRAKDNAASNGNNTVLDVREGEGVYLNTPIAYPRITESEILFMEISGGGEKYGVSRYPNDDGGFIFHYYVDGQKESIPYMPPIMTAEGSFNYESLYAIENSDGFGQIYYLTYLCSALGTPFFSERIDLPKDDTPEGKVKRETLLKNYGLTQSESTTITFEYCSRDGGTKEIIDGTYNWRVITIGGKALSDTGYYFMVDNRDYVYYTNSEYFSYALGGFASFVKGTLVSEGLEQDSVYGPYLTTSFKTWVGTVFNGAEDKVFTADMPGYNHYENPTVVVKGDYKSSLDKGLDFVPSNNDFSGYETDEGVELKFDLEAMKNHHSYDRIKNTFVGKNVGEYQEKILLTLLEDLYTSDEKVISFGEENSVEYLYEILAIESVISDEAERTSGTVGAEDTLLKVTYRYTVGGKTVAHDCHAVIDLNDIIVDDNTEDAYNPLADEAKNSFLGKPVGTPLGADAFTVSVDYTKDENGSLKTTEKYVLTGILSIFDENAAPASAVTETSYVNISYYVEIDGVKGKTQTTIVRLCDLKEGDKLFALKEILLGKSKSENLKETVYNGEYRYEFMREFATYEISEIKYFVANEIIVSFAFCNASQRDPFYGDTFYKNTLSNQNGIYGLNSGSCEAAVKLLGGVAGESNSATGLSGETVAIGLSLENMEKYGLYAHKIYFEMPRGIFDASESSDGSDSDVLSDFDWLTTIGFTLYISDVQYENGEKFRYIGSDMYDIVAKVTSEEFDFVEYGFVEFWARRNMVMMDIKKLEQIKFEFNMEDLQGDYAFDVTFKTVYQAYMNGQYYVSDTPINGYSPVERQIVRVKASADAFSTEFKDRVGAEKWSDLASLYDITIGGGKTSYYPGTDMTYGAAYFNSVYETLQLTAYVGCLTEDEQAKGFTMPRIMRMHLKVDGADEYYTYDFYRIDDRRIMVSIYRTDANGNRVEKYGEPVSDFYISTFAFKKLVNNYIHLLNGQPVDENVAYPD